MLLVSVAWCGHFALIKFLSIATSLVIVNCYNVNYCQWRHNTNHDNEDHLNTVNRERKCNHIERLLGIDNV